MTNHELLVAAKQSTKGLNSIETDLVTLVQEIGADDMIIRSSKDFGDYLHVINTAKDLCYKVRLGDNVDLNSNDPIDELGRNYIIRGGISTIEGPGFGKPWLTFGTPGAANVDKARKSVTDFLAKFNVKASVNAQKAGN